MSSRITDTTPVRFDSRLVALWLGWYSYLARSFIALSLRSAETRGLSLRARDVVCLLSRFGDGPSAADSERLQPSLVGLRPLVSAHRARVWTRGYFTRASRRSTFGFTRFAASRADTFPRNMGL